MRLATPPGFATEVFVQEAPSPDLLPAGPWTLVGDPVLRLAWIAAGMPEPPGTRWIPLGEPEKRLTAILPWLEAWAELPLHRDATIVAVGGGVLTDLAGLAAALYLRGVAWQAWPSTVLSMADAGLGGKTGADLPAGKNLVGAFHPPKRLVACTGFLATLPERQAESGRFELIKTALLLGDAEWLDALLAPGPVRTPWIERALQFKAEIVHRDPTEQGERRLLNLGHTLGHAVESASGYTLLHGEAVGFGLLAACLLSESQGLRPFPPDLLRRLAARLAPLAPALPAWEALLPWMARDKKATQSGGQVEIHCILPRPGEPALQRRLPPAAWAEPYARLKHFLQEDPARA